MAARRQGPGRVYLMAPAQWKFVGPAACAGVAVRPVVMSPSAWPASKRSLPPPTTPPRRLAAGRIDSLRAAAQHALVRLDLASAGAGLTARAGQWKQLAGERRTTIRAASFCAGFGAIAILLGVGIAHSNTEPRNAVLASGPMMQRPLASASEAKAVLAPVAPPVAVTAVVASRASSASPVVPAAATPVAVLASEASTMDLLMPLAEPDLNITSERSLWAQVGKESGVDPLLLYSIALVESRALFPDGNAAPTPWLFRVNDHLVLGERHHVQLAMAAASQLGSAVQDVGIMQVYYPMHRGEVQGPLTLLDPKTNISIAAKILRDGMHQTSDPVLGVGYYHSHTPQLARDYGTAVMTVYQRLKVLYRPGKELRLARRY